MRDATLAATRAESDAARARFERLYELEKRRVRIDDVLQYVALAGYTSDAARAFGLCRDFWLNDVQLRWALKDARHGKWKMTRLMWACIKGYLPRVRELITWESDVNAQDAQGLTPLHFALGHLAVARELVGRGAKLEAKDKNGNTPLHNASHIGHLDVVRFLLDAGADIEAKSNNSCTPLYNASQEGKLEVVRELLARGAAVDARANDGRTPLHASCSNGHAFVIRELYLRGADLTAIGHSLRSALIYACVFGHLLAATLIIGLGANLALRTAAGTSALGHASALVAVDAAPGASVTAEKRKEHADLVALLKLFGAPP